MKQIYLIPLLCGLSASATSYYVDYASGNDSNAGTSTGAAWKNHPYMTGWAGSYSHAAGDRFIFKGGVTWGHSCLPLKIVAGGGDSAQDYYGVDASWYAGGAWSRPVFDAEGKAVTNAVGNKIISLGAKSVMIDNFELTGFYYDAANQGEGTRMIGSYGNFTNLFIANCYLHGWSHDTFANGTVDWLSVISLDYTINSSAPGNIVSNCVIYGNGDSGRAIVGCIDLITRNAISNVPNGILYTSTNTTISFNDVGPMILDFDQVNIHPNAMEQLGGGGTIRIFGNYVHDTHPEDTSIMPIYTGTFSDTNSTVAYIYNNVVWNVGRSCVELNAREAAGTVYLWNNTFRPVDGSPATYVTTGNTATLYATNNHVIGSAGLYSLYDAVYTNYNLIQTWAAATNDGYVVSTRFAPSSATATTVGAGVATPYSTDILGITRPQGGTWDIGAYEYVPTGGNSATVGTLTIY